MTVLPSYDLIDSRAEPFGSEQLAGNVYVANFFFTRCTTVCPMLTSSMSKLLRRYREGGVDGIRLVSISVDGAYDTPDQLAAYAERFEIETESWSLLTGPPEQVRPLVIEGFRLPLGDRHEDERGMDIAHAGRLVLVDRWGQVRGYYASDASGLDELFRRSQHVLEEKHRPPPQTS
jgi:protein SCO1/2